MLVRGLNRTKNPGQTASTPAEGAMARRSQRVTFAPAAGHRTLLARGLVGSGRRSGRAMRQAVMSELPGTAQARTAAARGRGPCGGPRAALGLTRKLRAVGTGPPRGTGRSRDRRQTQKLCPSTPPGSGGPRPFVLLSGGPEEGLPHPSAEGTQEGHQGRARAFLPGPRGPGPEGRRLRTRHGGGVGRQVEGKGALTPAGPATASPGLNPVGCKES